MMKPKVESLSAFTFSFTAIPNALIDEVMPTLKDTEWRLLCVIARQTLGWNTKSGKRKQRDWMSQSQLIARTGRNSAALSAALDVLVKKQLVECQNAQGDSLLTPEQRRRHRGRVYFCLAQRLFKAPKTELQKAKWTKEKEDKRNSLQKEERTQSRVYRGWTSAGEIAIKRNYPAATKES